MLVRSLISKGLAGLLALGISAAPLAVAATDTTAMKVGVINVREIIAKSKQAQSAGEKLQKEFAPREKQVNDLVVQIKSKTEAFQKDSAVLSEAAKAKSEREIVTLQRDLQRLQTELREDSTARQTDEMNKLMSRVRDVVETLGKEEKFDLIIHADAVTFSSKSHDITDKVIAKLDKS